MAAPRWLESGGRRTDARPASAIFPLPPCAYGAGTDPHCRDRVVPSSAQSSQSLPESFGTKGMMIRQPEELATTLKWARDGWPDGGWDLVEYRDKGLSLRELPSADQWATIHRRAARRKPAGGKEYRRAYAAPLASTLSAPGATTTLPERKSPRDNHRLMEIVPPSALATEEPIVAPPGRVKSA